ncbi:MAG: hypothetical protein ABIQ16_28440, partial [Polyangiaceae bacterium]
MSQAIRTFARGFRNLALIPLLLITGGACARALAPPPIGPDPVHTDGDKYQLVLENQLVRVLHYHDE